MRSADDRGPIAASSGAGVTGNPDKKSEWLVHDRSSLDGAGSVRATERSPFSPHKRVEQVLRTRDEKQQMPQRLSTSPDGMQTGISEGLEETCVLLLGM